MVEEIRAMWYDILEELLQCPVCLEATQTMKYQCTNGHHLCRACRMQLQICPICKSNFIQTRNLAVEQISDKLHDIKISLLHPYHQLNRRVLQNKVCVATQTENTVCTASTSSACQTEPMAQIKTAMKNEEQKSAFILAPRVGRGLYPCRIGACTAELPHGRMIGHLRYYHMNMFHEFTAQDTTFKKKWMLEYLCDCKYDFAFQIKGMGLFFLNVIVTPTGGLMAHMQIVNCIAVSKQFTYTLEVVGALNASYTGVVKSCRVLSKEYSNGNCLRVPERNMRHTVDGKNLFHCNITVKRKLDQGASNGPQDNPVNVDAPEAAFD